MKYLLILFLLPLSEIAEGSSSKWMGVEIGIIGAASAEILKSAIGEVDQNDFEGLLIKLDTPGGSLDATRTMVKDIMNANFPIVVWVGPKGSRAASAGAFITLASHIAAMAPGTNIGAAHPISASGKDIGQGDAAEKVMNDTSAFIVSIAKARNRNEEMAKSFVLTSASITAEEALENKVIDLIAEAPEDLFAKIDGKEINLGADTVKTLATKDAEIVAFNPSFKQQFLEILSNPNLFYLLFVAGLIGLGFELTHPGSIFPGVAGGISMILALIATSVLPVNFGAMLLLFVGIALLIAEMFVPSFGILGIGGFVAFVIGSFLLVDPGNIQGLRIAWYTILPGAIAVASAALLIGYLVFRSERSKVKAGTEGMIGEEGEALEDFVNRKGRVRVHGEIWSAELSNINIERLSDLDLPRKGDRIKVLKVEGLTAVVSKKEET